jgi:hypothetical protein
MSRECMCSQNANNKYRQAFRKLGFEKKRKWLKRDIT